MTQSVPGLLKIRDSTIILSTVCDVMLFSDDGGNSWVTYVIVGCSTKFLGDSGNCWVMYVNVRTLRNCWSI